MDIGLRHRRAGSPGPPRLIRAAHRRRSAGAPCVPRVATSPPASFPPRLTSEQLPSACGWCHQPPQGTRTPELLVMLGRTRVGPAPSTLGPLRTGLATFHRIRLKQAHRGLITQGPTIRSDGERVVRRSTHRGHGRERLVCPLVLGLVVIVVFTGSPDRVSALSRPGTRSVSGRLSDDGQLEGAGHRVPVSRCVSAAGISFLVILFPPRDWASPYGRLTGARDGRTSTGFPCFARTSCDPGWVPSLLRGRRCSP